MKLPGHLRRLAFFASTALFTVAALAQDAPILPPAIPAAQPPALPATLAAEAAVQAAAPAGATSYGMSWGEAWHYGGFIMWILLALSIVMVALVIYFLCVFRPDRRLFPSWVKWAALSTAAMRNMLCCRTNRSVR